MKHAFFKWFLHNRKNDIRRFQKKKNGRMDFRNSGNLEKFLRTFQNSSKFIQILQKLFEIRQNFSEFFQIIQKVFLILQKYSEFF
jgi:hypothetical protein